MSLSYEMQMFMNVILSCGQAWLEELERSLRSNTGNREEIDRAEATFNLRNMEFCEIVEGLWSYFWLLYHPCNRKSEYDQKVALLMVYLVLVSNLWIRASAAHNIEAFSRWGSLERVWMWCYRSGRNWPPGQDSGILAEGMTENRAAFLDYFLSSYFP